MAVESLSTSGSPTAEALMRDLAARGASGVLEICHPGDEVSHVWVRGGGVYAMQVPGYRPALGIRLLSGGLVSPEQLSTAVSEQRERFPTHRIGEVLVGLGVVAPDVIEAFTREQVLDQVADLMDLPITRATFHPGRLVRHDVIEPTEVGELLEVARDRRAQRADVLTQVGGPRVVPQLGPPGQRPAQTPLGPYDWALLCRVDGRRDITELARVCGYTVHEAAQIVADLALTGLLAIPGPRPAAEEPLARVVALRPGVEEPLPDPQWQFDGTDAGEPEPVGSLLAEFSAFVNDPSGGQAPGEPDTGAEPGSRVEHSDPVALREPGAPWSVGPEPPVPSAAWVPADGAADQAWGDLSTPASQEGTPPTQAPPPDPVDPPSAPQGEAAESATGPAADRPDPATGEPPPQPAQAVVPPPPAERSAPAHGSITFPAEAPVLPPEAGPRPGQAASVPAPGEDAGYSDASVFMRELSSLSDTTDAEPPVITRMVVPFVEPKRKRRLWGR